MDGWMGGWLEGGRDLISVSHQPLFSLTKSKLWKLNLFCWIIFVFCQSQTLPVSLSFRPGSSRIDDVRVDVWIRGCGALLSWDGVHFYRWSWKNQGQNGFRRCSIPRGWEWVQIIACVSLSLWMTETFNPSLFLVFNETSAPRCSGYCWLLLIHQQGCQNNLCCQYRTRSLTVLFYTSAIFLFYFKVLTLNFRGLCCALQVWPRTSHISWIGGMFLNSVGGNILCCDSLQSNMA